MVGGAHHPALDAVDVRLRVLVDPALVAAVLGRVDGDEPRDAPAPGQLARRGGDQPVVRVHEVEAAAELDARGEHVLVHVVDPGDERVEVVAREVRLAHAVDDHAVAVLDRGRGGRRRGSRRGSRARRARAARRACGRAARGRLRRSAGTPTRGSGSARRRGSLAGQRQARESLRRGAPAASHAPRPRRFPLAPHQLPMRARELRPQRDAPAGGHGERLPGERAAARDEAPPSR